MSRCMPNGRRRAEAPAPLDSYTALAAVTHDPKIDDFALKAALDAELLLCRRARQPQDPRQARRAPAGAGRDGRADRAHPCADRPRHRRGKPGRDRRGGAGADDPRLPRARLRLQVEGRGGMKFGPVAVDGRGRRGAGACHDRRRQALPQGACARAPTISRVLKAAGIETVVAAGWPPTISARMPRRRGLPRRMRHARHRGQAGRDRPRQPARRGRPASSPSTRRWSTRVNAVDPAITLATLAAVRRRRGGPDGRDGEDHSLRRRRRPGRAGGRDPAQAGETFAVHAVSRRCASA